MTTVIGFGYGGSCKAGSQMWDNRSPSKYHFRRHYMRNDVTYSGSFYGHDIVQGADYDPGFGALEIKQNQYFPQVYAFLCSSEYFYFEIEEYDFKDNKLEFNNRQYRRVKGLGIPSTENKTLNFKTGFVDSFLPVRNWSQPGDIYYAPPGKAEDYVLDEIDRTIEITKNDNYDYYDSVDEFTEDVLFRYPYYDNKIQGKLLDIAIYKKG